ncbi:MAG TPA: hypothetical protein PKA63_10560 [Oligoflexia bacterium]|nr:hypothetical protein [Oligoflexia bacterium]
MIYLITILAIILGFLVVAYLYYTFVENNSEEPTAVRKWTDPSHKE